MTRMIPGILNIRAQRQPIYDRIDLWMRHKSFESDRWTVARDITFEEYNPYDPSLSSLPEPFLSIDMGAAQELMDELWNCGLRPTEGTGSAGALRAVENHLADMRKLVFDLFEQVKMPAFYRALSSEEREQIIKGGR